MPSTRGTDPESNARHAQVDRARKTTSEAYPLHSEPTSIAIEEARVNDPASPSDAASGAGARRARSPPNSRQKKARPVTGRAKSTKGGGWRRQSTACDPDRKLQGGKKHMGSFPPAKRHHCINATGSTIHKILVRRKNFVCPFDFFKPPSKFFVKSLFLSHFEERPFFFCSQKSPLFSKKTGFRRLDDTGPPAAGADVQGRSPASCPNQPSPAFT